MRGLHTPHATTTYSAAMRPWSVMTARTRPSTTSTSSTSTPGNGLQRAELHGALAEDRPGAERVDHETLGV